MPAEIVGKERKREGLGGNERKRDGERKRERERVTPSMLTDLFGVYRIYIVINSTMRFMLNGRECIL